MCAYYKHQINGQYVYLDFLGKKEKNLILTLLINILQRESYDTLKLFSRKE